MRTSLLGTDAAAWEAFLAKTRHDFYHLPAYVALCASGEQGEPRALLVEDGDRSMLLPLILRPIHGGAYDAVSPYGYPCPLVHPAPDPAFLRDALVAGGEMLAATGVIALFVRFHPLLEPTPPEGVGTVVRHGDTVSADLSLSNEELWQQTRHGHRTQIHQAQRAGRVAAFDDSFRRYADFRRLYQATMSRVEASPSYFFDDAYFDGLPRALGDRLRLCVVEVGEVIAAGAMFVETCGIVQFHLSASDPQFSREAPTKLIIDYVRSWAKERADRVLHLGGGLGAADDSLFSFKAGFSPIRHPYHTLRIVYDQPEYAKLVFAKDPTADPTLLDGFFPQYRTI